MTARFRILASFVVIGMAAAIVGCGPTYQADSADSDDATVATTEDGADGAATDESDDDSLKDGSLKDDAVNADSSKDDAVTEDLEKDAALADEADKTDDADAGKSDDDKSDDGDDPLTDDAEAPMEKPSLSIGSAAPALSIAEWVQGDPIKAMQADQIHVVEFWATWCGPCLQSMPHINTLQEEYKDKVQFVGITDEDKETVDGFLGQEQEADKLWKDVVQYRLAIDKDGKTNKSYMNASGELGIPTAFIVGRDGHIEWIGHPMSIDAPLKQIVAGEWDRSKAIAEREAEREKAARLASLQQALGALFQEEKWDDALTKIDEYGKTNGESTVVTGMRIAFLQGAGRTDEVNSQVGKMIEQLWEDAQSLNRWARGMATGELEVGNMELAEKAAVRAVELSESKDAAILDTMARIYYEKGDLDKAIEWQQKAVDADTAGSPELSDTLKKYQTEKAGGAPAETDPKTEEATEDEAPAESTEETPAAEADPAAEAPATEEPAAVEPAAEEPATP